MSFHGIFKKVIGESFSSSKDNRERDEQKKINEAYDDNALGWLTRNNILPQVFGGEYNGLRVPSALNPGNSVPVWGSGRKYMTYPFVGINGYANFPALAAKHGNEASFINGKLKSINANTNVRNILSRQVAAGTGIPANVFLMFPQMPIESVGKKILKKSQTLFNTYNLRDSFRNSIYPYNVQQALSLNADGNLYPDPMKPGGVVLCPVARSGGMAVTKEIMYLRKIQLYDILALGKLYDRSILAEQLTGSGRLDFPNPGGYLLSYMSGTRTENDLPGGNPKFFHWNEFIEDKGFITKDGNIDFIAIRKWILEEDAKKIGEELLIPYMLKSPMDRTYCWAKVDSAKKEEFKSDIAVYEALVETGKFEDSLEDIESDKFEFEIDDVVGDDDLSESVTIKFESPEDVEKMLCEASDNTPSITENSSREEIMAIFNKFVKTHGTTISIKPESRDMDLLRDDGRIATKHSGMKHTFARIITRSMPLMDIDYKFCPKGLDTLKVSYSGTLDYSPLFSSFSEILNDKMPKTFKFLRIVGYMISFEYDPAIEDEYKKFYGKGKIRSLGMLKYYLESPNSVKLREPTVFDVTYIKGGNYGDFLFSSYGLVPSKNVMHLGDEPPEAMIANKLYADNVDGLHSVMAYDLERIHMAGRYNVGIQ